MKARLIPPLKANASPEVVYYAHSMQIYGTSETAQIRDTIAALLPEAAILDPEMLPWKEWAEASSNLAVYQGVIKACSRVVVYEHQGHVGRGVATEVDIALKLGKPVHVLRTIDDAPQLIPVRRWATMNRGDWKVAYAKVFTR